MQARSEGARRCGEMKGPVGVQFSASCADIWGSCFLRVPLFLCWLVQKGKPQGSIGIFGGALKKTHPFVRPYSWLVNVASLGPTNGFPIQRHVLMDKDVHSTTVVGLWSPKVRLG